MTGYPGWPRHALSDQVFPLTIVPGVSPGSQELPFFAGGLRIDNPSGSWYRIANTNIVIPPYTLGLQYLLRPTVKSLDLRWLTSYAGMPSKKIGEPLRVYATSFDLAASTGIEVSASSPFVSTYVARVPMGSNYVDSVQAWSLFPKTPSANRPRIRLLSMELDVSQLPTVANDLLVILSWITSENTGLPALSFNSRDGDDTFAADSLVNLRGYDGAVSGIIYDRAWETRIYVPNIRPCGPFYWEWDDDGPEIPMGAWSSERQLGLMLTFQSNPTPADYRIRSQIVWTEEPGT